VSNKNLETEMKNKKCATILTTLLMALSLSSPAIAADGKVPLAQSERDYSGISAAGCSAGLVVGWLMAISKLDYGMGMTKSLATSCAAGAAMGAGMRFLIGPNEEERMDTQASDLQNIARKPADGGPAISSSQNSSNKAATVQ
jgi:uncharacterized membrane protein